MRNLHQLFVLCTASQIIDGSFGKCVAFSEYMSFKNAEAKKENVIWFQKKFHPISDIPHCDFIEGIVSSLVTAEGERKQDREKDST